MSDKRFRAAVITVSDKGYIGERVDLSGPEAKEILENDQYEVVSMVIVPDGPELLKKELIRLCDDEEVDLIVTSGGTGFSHRDLTPEVTMEVAERNAPGIAEYIRMKSLVKTGHAMLSRGVSVLRKNTLIVNLPGSPKAVSESLSFILPYIPHGLKVLKGEASECARK